MKEIKSGKLKQLIGSLFGIKDWNLKADGHLNVSEDEMIRLNAEYGADFVTKFEKLLAEESDYKPENTQPKSDMLKLTMLCAILAVEGITLSEDGNATLSKEQLEKIEAGLKKLSDEKLAADSAQTSAKTEKDAAEKALSDAVKAMDDLDATIKEAKDPVAKVEAIRKKLAEKPAVNANGALNHDENQGNKIEGTDEVNAFVSQYFSK